MREIPDVMEDVERGFFMPPMLISNTSVVPTVPEAYTDEIVTLLFAPLQFRELEIVAGPLDFVHVRVPSVLI